MRASAFQTEMFAIFGERINQQPVRFNVTIAAARKISAQRVILILQWQLIASNQQVKDGLELFQILATLASEFDILLKLRCATECPHSTRSA